MSRRDIIRVCGLLWVLLALPLQAYAEKPAGLAPGWPNDRPVGAECPAPDVIEKRIEHHLGRTLHEADPSLRITTRLERTDTGYRLSLRTAHEGPHDALLEGGARAFEGERCDELVEAAALLIALSIDPLAVPRPESPGTAVEPSAPPAPAADESPQEPAKPSAPHRSLRGELRAGGLLDMGYLPRAGAGFELGAGLSFARSRLELSLLGLPAVRSPRAIDGAQVKVSLWSARASYCHRALGSRLGSLAACAGLELGRASGDGIDVVMASERHFLWSASYLALRFSSELTRWLAISLEPGVAIPFARSRFVSSDADGTPLATLHTPGRASGRLALSLSALF